MTIARQEERLSDKIKSLSTDYQSNKEYVAQRLTSISKSLGDITRRVDALEKSLPKVEIKHFEERCREYITKVGELEKEVRGIQKDLSSRLDQLSQSVSGLSQSAISKGTVDKIMGDYQSISEQLEAVNVNIQKLARGMMLLCDKEIERVQQVRQEFRALKNEVEKKLRLVS